MDEVKFVIADMGDWEFAQERDCEIRSGTADKRDPDLTRLSVSTICRRSPKRSPQSGSESPAEYAAAQIYLGSGSSGRMSVAKAIVLVSGGMDRALRPRSQLTENAELAFLHISYGQRTEARERKAFNDIADHYEID